MNTSSGYKSDIKTIPGVNSGGISLVEAPKPVDAASHGDAETEVEDEQQIFEGFLKQQSIDSSGIYQWNRKFFRLFVSKGVMEVLEIDDIDANHADHNRLSSSRDVSASFSSATGGLAADTISLAGLRSAKEWTAMTSALGSCGFDLLWASGNGRSWS
jgi:hypothetical protein